MVEKNRHFNITKTRNLLPHEKTKKMKTSCVWYKEFDKTTTCKCESGVGEDNITIICDNFPTAPKAICGLKDNQTLICSLKFGEETDVYNFIQEEQQKTVNNTFRYVKVG